MKKQHQLILAKAQALGIGVEDISELMGCDAARLTLGTQEELLIRGTPTAQINLRSQYYCDNKQLTKIAYKTLAIPSPDSIAFTAIDPLIFMPFFKKEKNYVCKPVNGTNGVGVALNIRDMEGLQAYWEVYKSLGDTFMLEEQVAGTDLRVQVIGGKIVAACTRVPAFVTGDGDQSLQQLIALQQLKTKKQNEANELIIDELTLGLLEEQGYRLEDIPAQGQVIVLKKVANMAQGAIAVDLTDELDETYQGWIDRLTDFLKVDYFAIDIMAIDHHRPPNEDAWVIEINARPEWLHHTFSDRRQHDMAGLLLKSIFGISSS